MEARSLLVREASGGDRAAACAVAVMAKASRPGVTKTRLTPPLSSQAAADLNTAFLQDISGNVEKAAGEADLHLYMAYGPPGADAFFRELCTPRTGLIEVWSPDFGFCLAETLKRLLELGYGSAIVLNSDSPTLPTARLVEAASMLRRAGDRAVLGPSEDGGYYLLGLKRLHARLFEDVAWSTDRVCGQTLARAGEIGLEVARLQPWYDVDDAESLTRLTADLGKTPRGYAAPHTAAALRKLGVMGIEAVGADRG